MGTGDHNAGGEGTPSCMGWTSIPFREEFLVAITEAPV